MQQRRMYEEMQSVVRHESDRVIDSVLGGPHTKIQDPIIREVWKDTRWRGHVKTREFILVLRDHYLQRIYQEDVAMYGCDSPITSSDDKWALECLNVNYISAISEALDDDGSGFLTISKVNQFTSSRPEGWSLLHWIAFWAKGWRMATTHYNDKLNALVAEMFALIPHLRVENRLKACWYLVTVWPILAQVLATFDRVEVDIEGDLWGRFQGYIESEENRLEEGLKTFHYFIDAADTVTLITGPGRIERFLMPLYYLLVRRDLEILRLCHEKVVINHMELYRSATSIALAVAEVAQSRIGALEAVFKLRHLDPEKQMKSFAYGLYYATYKSERLWSMKTRVTFKERDAGTFEEIEPDLKACRDPGEILTLPAPVEGPSITAQDTLSEADMLETDGPLKSMLGRWHGFFGHGENWPDSPMVSFFLHTSGPGALSSRSRTATGVSYTIKAQCATRKDGTAEFAAHWELIGMTEDRFLKGTVSEDGQSMSGVWSSAEGELTETTDEFYFTRSSPELLTVRPRPRVLEAGTKKTKVLWRFALDATLLRVRRRQPWRYLKDLIQRWSAYIDLLAPQTSMSPARRGETSSSEDTAHALSEIERSFTFDEACFCHIALELRNRAFVEMHYNYFCDFCGATHGPHDARYTCIPCSIAADTSVDVCDTLACRGATFTTHRPAHDMLNIRGLVIWQRELPELIRRARAATARADEALKADEGGEGSRLGCASCSAAVGYPFFVCLDCAGGSEDVYICATCDEQTGGISAGTHTPQHTLVRCLSPAERSAEGPEGVEERLSAIEDKVASYSDRMDRIERLLEGMSSTLLRLAPP